MIQGQQKRNEIYIPKYFGLISKFFLNSFKIEFFAD
jgi:hypothetical protein